MKYSNFSSLTALFFRPLAALQKCRRLWPALLLTLTACVPRPIDIDVAPAESQIVIASQVIPDRALVVAVTRSFSALAIDVENGDSVSNDFLSDLLVEHARVTVSFAGVTEELFRLGPGVYASINTLQFPNEVYALQVYDSTTDQTVTSNTLMLPFVGFDTLRPIVDRTVGDTSIQLEYSITDPPGDNWYAINVVKQGDANSNAGIDINSFFSAGLNVITQTRLVSDKAFSGNTISEKFDLLEVNAEDSIVVTISNISREYFDYLQASERAQGLLSSITQEPINRPTNIRDGLGFFNAHFPDIRYFDLKEW